MKLSKLAWAGLIAAAFVVPASANPIFEDFNSFNLGAIPGGADGRAPGNGAWWNPDNAATSSVVTDGVGRSGGRGLVIGNRGNGNDGVITNTLSARLTDSAGESSTGAAFNIFRSSYWFRTVPTSNPSGNFRFRSESWGTDRTSFLGFQNDGSGNLTATAFGASSQSAFPSVSLNTNLVWGDWYQVTSEIVFNDGVDNDVVTHRIFDALGNQVGQDLVVGSWEGGQRAGFNGGLLVAVDAIQFHSRGGFAGDHVIVDDVRWEAVPEPMTMSVMALGAMAALRKRRQKKA
jgi:hypothetical protein